MENILNSNIPVISIIVSAVIGIGCAFSIYKSLKTKGFTSIKTIKKFAKELVNNEEIINIISEVFTCVDIDISKYNSKYELLSDQLDKVEDKLYIYFKSSKDISPIIKKVITRDNISAVSDYIMNKMGFDTDLILSNYDSLKKKHEKELEEKSKTKVIEENVEENNNTEAVETSEEVEETVETELVEEELTLGEEVETSDELEETVETDKLVEEGNSENDEITENPIKERIRLVVPAEDGLKELENIEVSENDNENIENNVKEEIEKVEDKKEKTEEKKKSTKKRKKKTTKKEK